ncbi:hypothetical protein HDU87_006046 [Geranomyces variabilis]|uniref:Uncharacterized protein n=1 Tax=Geranomyces variabilis TaxID=109894 RepID=A0AAD5TQB8_9FUNG|nr:hypothetical protein HDU87_006046 [Geranomyces variabilis]
MSFSWNDIDERQRSRNEEEKRLKEYLKGQQQEVKERKLRQKKEDLQENQRIYGIGGSPWRDNLKPKPPPRSPEMDIAPQAEPALNDYQRRQPPSLPALPSASLPTSAIMHLPLLQDAATARTADLESQLAQERRTRTKLELDVEAGKTALASLSAKIDQLTAAVSASQISSRDTAHLAADADRRAREIEQALDTRLGSTAVTVKHMIADLDGRHQRQDGQTREDETERYHFVMEQVSGLTHRIELLQQRTVETEETLRMKTQDLHHELRIGVDALRIAQAHESTIGSLHATVDARITALERRLDDSIRDMAARVENEARVREQVAETHWAKICAIVSRHERQDFETADRVEALRGTLTLIADQDREDAKQATQFQADQIKDVERGIVGIFEKLSERILSVEARISAEAAARGAMHDKVDSDRLQAIAQTEAQVRKLVDSVRVQCADGRKHQASAIAALKDSVRQAEAKVLGRSESLEQVLHAEVSQRSETAAAVQKNLIELHENVGNTSSLLAGQIDNLRHHTAAQVEAVRKEVLKTCDDNSSVKSDALHEQEAQLTALRIRFHNFENTFTADMQITRREFDQLAHNLAAVSDGLDARLDQRVQLLRQELGQNRAASEAASAALSADINETIHVKTLDVDKAIKSLRIDINKMIDKEEFELMTDKMRTETQILRADVDKLAHAAATVEKSPQPVPASPAPHKHLVQEDEFIKANKELKAEIDSLAQMSAQVRTEQIEINDSTQRVTNELADNLLKLQQRQVEILAHISGLQLMVQDAASYDHVSNIQSQLNANVSLATTQLRETFGDRFQDMHKALSDVHAQQHAMARTEARHRATLQASLTKLVREQEAQCKDLATVSGAHKKALAHDFMTQLQQTRAGLETTVGHLSTRVTDSNQLCKDRSQEMRDLVNRIRQEVAMASAERGFVNARRASEHGSAERSPVNARRGSENRSETVPIDSNYPSEVLEQAHKREVPTGINQAAVPEHSSTSHAGPSAMPEPPPILVQAPTPHEIAVTISPLIEPSASNAAAVPPISDHVHSLSPSKDDAPPAMPLQSPHAANHEPSDSSFMIQEYHDPPQVVLAPETFFKPPHLTAPILPQEGAMPSAFEKHPAGSHEKEGSDPSTAPVTSAKHPNPASDADSHRENLERLADEAMGKLGRQNDAR